MPRLEEKTSSSSRFGQWTGLPSRARQSSYHSQRCQVGQYPIERKLDGQGCGLWPIQISYGRCKRTRFHTSKRHDGNYDGSTIYYFFLAVTWLVALEESILQPDEFSHVVGLFGSRILHDPAADGKERRLQFRSSHA